MPKFKPQPQGANGEIQALKEEREYLKKRITAVPEQDQRILIKWIGEVENEILRKTKLRGGKKNG